MHSVFPPGTRAAVIKAAEKAGAIFTIQTLVRVLILLMVRYNVVHLKKGGPWADVQHAGGPVVLRGTGQIPYDYIAFRIKDQRHFECQLSF